MLLYLETDLDRAYKLDCKARAKCDEPWVTREQFRSLYESLIKMINTDFDKRNKMSINSRNFIKKEFAVNIINQKILETIEI